LGEAYYTKKVNISSGTPVILQMKSKIGSGSNLRPEGLVCKRPWRCCAFCEGV